MKKIMNNKKGIDTILAALLMVVIVVVASVMVYAWSTGLLGALMGGGTGNVGKEALIMEFSGFNTGTNVTMNLRNTGTAATQLASYYVKDSTGNQYARLNWQLAGGPNIPAQISPNAVGIVYVTIGTGASPPQCGTGCTLTGSAFTFTSGYSYTVQIVTSRNTQFSFTVTR